MEPRLHLVTKEEMREEMTVVVVEDAAVVVEDLEAVVDSVVVEDLEVLEDIVADSEEEEDSEEIEEDSVAMEELEVEEDLEAEEGDSAEDMMEEKAVLRLDIISTSHKFDLLRRFTSATASAEFVFFSSLIIPRWIFCYIANDQGYKTTRVL